MKKEFQKRFAAYKRKFYQLQADMIIEQLRAAQEMEIWMLWDFWFERGVRLDFDAKENDIYLK